MFLLYFVLGSGQGFCLLKVRQIHQGTHQQPHGTVVIQESEVKVKNNSCSPGRHEEKFESKKVEFDSTINLRLGKSCHQQVDQRIKFHYFHTNATMLGKQWFA